MAIQPRMLPDDLTSDELLLIVETVREILWPKGTKPDDAEKAWDEKAVSLVEHVGSTLDDYGLRPAGRDD